MALSFEESKKLLMQQAATSMMMSLPTDNTGIMTLAADDNTEIPAYSEWTKSDKYIWNDQYADDKISRVDQNKNITVDASQINITQEENSQYIPFEMSRYYDGFDLMSTTLSIHYVTSDGYHGEAAPINVSYDTATIKFGWLIDGNVTHVAGNVKFEIWAIGANANGKAYVWKTRTYDKLNVIQSLIDNRSITLDDSWVQDLVTRVAENVAEEIAAVQVADQVAIATEAAAEAKSYAENASSAANEAVTSALVDYATIKYVDSIETGVGRDVEGTVYTVYDSETDSDIEVIAGKGAEVFNNYEKNIASNDWTHAEGFDTKALGNAAHAEGGYTTASGDASHAEGRNTVAGGMHSHAEGLYSEATSGSAHAEGEYTTASAIAAHAEGSRTTASGEDSHAEGRETLASAFASHAEGGFTKATGMGSHAEGNNTVAASNFQHAQGKYNIEDASDTYAHIVGNGAKDAPSNAHTIDWNGNAWFAGDVYVGSASGTNKDEGSKRLIKSGDRLSENLYTSEEFIAYTDSPLFDSGTEAHLNSSGLTIESLEGHEPTKLTENSLVFGWKGVEDIDGNKVNSGVIEGLDYATKDNQAVPYGQMKKEIAEVKFTGGTLRDEEGFFEADIAADGIQFEDMDFKQRSNLSATSLDFKVSVEGEGLVYGGGEINGLSNAIEDHQAIPYGQMKSELSNKFNKTGGIISNGDNENYLTIDSNKVHLWEEGRGGIESKLTKGELSMSNFPNDGDEYNTSVLNTISLSFYCDGEDGDQVLGGGKVSGLADATSNDQAVPYGQMKEYVDNAVENVSVDLTGYATEKFVTDKTDALSSSIATNTSSISSINKTIEEINQTIANIDDTPRVTYEATYGNVEMEDGTTQEYMFTLWETEGSNNPTVKSRFQIMGGGGGNTNSVTLRIAYIDGYTTPLVSTVDDRVIVKYNFSGEDSAGDTNLDGIASWKVGNRIIATEDVSTGECEFDLTDYVSVGDNKVLLTITHATGAVATKAWTVKVIDVRLTSAFDDTRKYTAGEQVSFAFIPYGGVDKTVHFLLDGKEIATKTSSAAAAGLSDSYMIPAQEHGTHLFEIYLTAVINNNTIESNHIIKDIIWYDESSNMPVIGCVDQTFTTRQYEAKNIIYTVYDPSTETPNVNLRATYVNNDGDTVEEYNSNLVLNKNTETWQYKSDVIGEHTLTITCGETVKTLVATVTELGINVSPITSGLAFDFNPVGYSNSDENRLWSSGNVSMTVSENFDWVNGGYQLDNNGDQCFCIKAGTSAEIDYELFGDDAKANGKQMKLIFKTENVADADTTFMSCVSASSAGDKIGIIMKAHEATIYASADKDKLPLPYAEEEIIEFEFNITPSTESPSMIMGYEDGVSTRPFVYNSTHNFQQQAGSRKTITLGSPDCDLYIYRFKVYENSLSDRDILNNFIADARSAEEMISRYERNQIYKEGILDPDYLADVCPQLRIIKLEVPYFTSDKDEKIGRFVSSTGVELISSAECIYKGGDPVLDNWVATDIVHSGQGTSSNNYGPAGRNLDIIMKRYRDKKTDKYLNENPIITFSDNTQASKVSLARNSVDVNYFNIKVNIASSENANNALLAKRFNAYQPYNRPIVRSTEEEAAKVKDTMEFQNCVIFVKESDPDLSTHREFNDNNWHFYAIGNIGDSKKTDDTRLTDPSDPYECILEVMDNTLPNSTMPTGVVDEDGSPVYPIAPEQWVAGNYAYDALYADLFDESKPEDKDNGLEDTYGWRYIYEDGTDEQNAEYRAYVEGKWREFYEFVVTATDEEFKAHLGDYCVLNSVMYYYLFTLRYTMTDNHAKNSFWHYGKTGEVDSDGNPIRKWDLNFDYDNDTALGIDNYGRMTYRYGYEEIDYVDGTNDWVWNAPQHVFFLRLRELFDDELSALYNVLPADCWSATSLINQFNDWQMQFPEELWRLDIERKYIRTYSGSYINGKAYPEFLTERANGRKKTQRAQFEKSQEKYMASKFGSTVAAADDIILRCSVPNTTLAVPANFDMHLTPYAYMYLNVKYNTSPPIKVRAVPNQEYTIEYTGDVADIIEIYSASCLKSIGDLSACYLTNGTFANATKIRDLVLGNGTYGYNNTNVMTLGLGSNGLLNKLDIRNMSGLTHSLELSGLKNLEELYASGSGVSGIVFADGGNIRIVEIPGVGSLSMKNLNYLTDDNFDMESYESLSKLVAENSKLDILSVLDKSANLYQVRLIGIDWDLEDTTLLERLYNLAGVTNTGANSEQSVLAGEVHVPIIKEKQFNDYKVAWTDLDISYNTLVNQFSVTYQNYDGTVLDIQYVDKGTLPIDPLTREENPIDIPTKPSTVSTNFTFAGWDSEPVAAFENQVITATYNETTRQYTVKYVSNGATLQETVADYGTIVQYNGEIPTYTAEEAAYKYYLFDGWDQGGYVNGDKTINAVFDSCEYNAGYFDGKTLGEMRPVEIYAMTKLGLERQYISSKDAVSIQFGYDVSYSDIEEKVLISEKTVFNGTNYIDTNEEIMSADRDFVIAIDYEFDNGNSNGNTLMQCFSDSQTSGFRLWYNSGTKLGWGTNSLNAPEVNNREIMVLRHVKGENGLHVYMSNTTSSESFYQELDAVQSMTHNGTLVFGCSKADDGVYEKHGFGTVYWSKIWYADLGDDVCAQIAYWPHEKINFEMCGFRRYYLSDNTSKRCSMSLLASDVLSQKMRLNNSQATTGGWAAFSLNSYLNTRIYDAFPYQWKQLLKKVTVKSSVGDKSVELSSSDCYINIPSAAEMSSNITEEPYYSEGSAIDYFTTDASRICYDKDGNAVSYFTRSPNAKYTNYIYTVGADGALSAFNYADSYHHVRVMISI